MDEIDRERVQRAVQAEVKARFPGDVVQQATLLHYGDDPEIEPGQLVVRLLIPGEVRGPDAEDDEPDALELFHQAHRAAIKQFRQALSQHLPQASRLEIKTAGNPHAAIRMPVAPRPRVALAAAPDERPPDLTPVMARLGPVDLETLDTLITAGIVSNRAEAVRWALARIRDRPAYAQLRERIQEIDELKARF
jgi:hypothetical protein